MLYYGCGETVQCLFLLQGAAWFCFMFSVLGLVIFIIRSCIFCRRRAVVPSMASRGGASVLAADDNYHGEASAGGPTEERPSVIWTANWRKGRGLTNTCL